jgi:hypothetical protein
MRFRLFIYIAVIAFGTGACTDTFLVYKRGHAYFVGSNSNSKYIMLCTSGDLKDVLDSSHLSREIKDNLYKYSCSAERSGEKIKQIFASMTVEERKDFKNAFRENGFSINTLDV